MLTELELLKQVKQGGYVTQLSDNDEFDATVKTIEQLAQAGYFAHAVFKKPNSESGAMTHDLIKIDRGLSILGEARLKQLSV